MKDYLKQYDMDRFKTSEDIDYRYMYNMVQRVLGENILKKNDKDSANSNSDWRWGGGSLSESARAAPAKVKPKAKPKAKPEAKPKAESKSRRKTPFNWVKGEWVAFVKTVLLVPVVLGLIPQRKILDRIQIKRNLEEGAHL